MPRWGTELPVQNAAMGIDKRRLLSVRVAPRWARRPPQFFPEDAQPVIRASGCLFLSLGVYLNGKASLNDGGMTDGQAGYLDSPGSARSAGVLFGLVKFSRGAHLLAKRTS